MRPTIPLAAAVLALALAPHHASALPGAGRLAAPAPAPALQADLAEQAPIIKVHSYHRTCQRGAAGWHFHTAYGARIACAPRRVIIIR